MTRYDSTPTRTPNTRDPGTSDLETDQYEILIVEDDDDMRQLLQQVLTDRGYRVITARTPIEALDIVEKLGTHDSPLYALDLVVIDWWMPAMTGGEFLEWLRQHDDTTPTIVISGYLTEETAREALRLEASAALAKPFSLAEFIEVVDCELPDTSSGRSA